MELSGKAKFNYCSEVVWEAMHDPELLKNAIPGCQNLNLVGDGKYDVELKLGVAAVKGDYTGKVKLEDVHVPSHYILTAEGSGKPGFVSAKMDCKIIPEGKGCQLIWECNADIGGMIAGVGSRVIGGIAKFMAGKFFKDIEKQLNVHQNI
ncbi:carbon monoxide dehydrogenase [Bacillus salipaludis]|uniref:Carbon monoxide dehydrogenase n=1 Tax=Bacillus salipaludis TaxID=2547811 RepID=A0A4R5VMB5_9BACI|nr:carbon monoxide dehydrogenase subunit G [Bacillus salipaludis]MDQ6596591.1 carbon monoxide dehydrogenase subunit G [Bacillus salipaludis]TDK58495.1 carbon monoxide dehydrogenase [Bacillus salipaludis]